MDGRQDLVAGQPLRYGQSITDACLGWDLTVPVLTDLAKAARSRRAALPPPSARGRQHPEALEPSKAKSRPCAASLAREPVTIEEVLHDLELPSAREPAPLVAIARRVHAAGRRLAVRRVALVEHEHDRLPIEPRVEGGQELAHPREIDMGEPERGQAPVEPADSRHVGVVLGQRHRGRRIRPAAGEGEGLGTEVLGMDARGHAGRALGPVAGAAGDLEHTAAGKRAPIRSPSRGRSRAQAGCE